LRISECEAVDDRCSSGSAAEVASGMAARGALGEVTAERTGAAARDRALGVTEGAPCMCTVHSTLRIPSRARAVVVSEAVTRS
jgi:hypothetical protein